MDYAEILRIVGGIFMGCCAVYLAGRGLAGWGWFLFAAVLLGTTTVKL